MKDLKYIKGDVLSTNCSLICHQVNCQGVMGSGLAKQIKDKYPNVYSDYLSFLRHKGKDRILGSATFTLIDGNRYIANMFSQFNYGHTAIRYTNYEAFYISLTHIYKFCINNNIKTIAFPYRIGCDRGRANWNIVECMIKEVLKDFEVSIYSL